MSEIVERMAKSFVEFMAIEDDGLTPWEDACEEARETMRKMARTAFAAIREPTEAMTKAGNKMVEWNNGADDAWEAMIDEAMK